MACYYWSGGSIIAVHICFCWNRKFGIKIVIFYDFIWIYWFWFQLNFINFRVFKMILHAKHILTYKIVRLYELNHDFNNFDSSLKNSSTKRTYFWHLVLWWRNVLFKESPHSIMVTRNHNWSTEILWYGTGCG
jgi:hypothetical protein